jgi:hypothetical protein
MHKVADGEMSFAKIHIDVKAKKAIFEYPEGTTSRGCIFMEILVSVGIVWGVMLALAMVILAQTGNPFTLWLLILPPIIFTTGLCLFRKDELSKFSAFYMRIMRLGHIDRLHIDSIKGCEYVLPTFENFYLGYHLQGDFAAYLVSIDIVPVYYGLHDQELATWQAVFKFSRHPKNGCMLLEFL